MKQSLIAHRGLKLFCASHCQVTQWCGQTCGCDLGPAQGGSLMGASTAGGSSLLGGLFGGAGGGLGALGGLPASVSTSGAVNSGWGSQGTQASANGFGSALSMLEGMGLTGRSGEQAAATKQQAAVPAGTSPLVAELSNTRAGQMVGSMADGMVNSGVVGAAVGKVAEQVVTNQVNAVLQAMWGGGAGAAGGRRA